MFLLDTNVVSELRKAASGRADRGVVEWAETRPLTDMFLSAVSLHELEVGVRRAEHVDPPKGRTLRIWLETTILPAFTDRVLPVDAAVALRAARFHVPNPASFSDALIGATASEHGMTVVTRNTDDFERFDGVKVFNPWSTNKRKT